jgi:lysophospholipase L1-like esterase
LSTFLVAVVVIVAAVFFLLRGTTPGSGEASASTATNFSAYYLAIGASSSTGIEPTGIPGHRSRHTQDGYTNDVVQLEGYKGVALTLTEIGCPGETVQTILDTKEKDHCYNLPVTQLTKAFSFFQANPGPGLVSIDLGFNDIRPCLSPDVVNVACADAGIAAVAADMPRLLKDLKDAAGAHVKFVGVEYYDPFLSHYFDGADGPAEATLTLQLMDKMNAALTDAYQSAGVAVADVAATFQMNDATKETIDNVGTIPVNVQQACNLTWMCQPAPFGPDDHPNDEGYLLIADAMTAVIPNSW